MLTSIITVAVVALATFTAAHAVLYKRDTRAVIAWVALIVIVPLAGALAYWLLAVNRVRRLASALRPRPAGHAAPGVAEGAVPPAALAPLAALGDRISPFTLSAGNHVEPLEDGDRAFPRMLEAIAGARRSIALATYIFDNDAVGQRFHDALADAHARGVAVRVLVDAVGQRYSRRSMVAKLRAAGIDAAAFLPVRIPRNLAAFNLRNHRKLLVLDGRTAFTGGMNLRVGNMLAESPPHPVRDLQFHIDGPVVAQLMHVFGDDWAFTTGERLDGDAWFPSRLRSAGTTLARAIPDGPDEHFEALKVVLLGALAQARTSIAVMTPYFLPDQSLIHALNTAALKGVSVDIVLPEQGNLKLVQWAAHAQYWQVLERGCRIWHSPPPFDHSKLLLVDDEWALVGSTNWDARSLRLNFELNVECYDAALGAALRQWFERRRAAARPVTLDEANGRPLPVRLRDGAARLLTPYL